MENASVEHKNRKPNLLNSETENQSLYICIHHLIRETYHSPLSIHYTPSTISLAFFFFFFFFLHVQIL